MTIATVSARISEIQQQFALLQNSRATAPVGTADGFAAALSAAGPGAATGAATGTAPTDGSSRTAGDPAGGGAVVAEARKYLGVPYRWGGTDPATGLDCSALVQKVYGDLGYDLPRVSYQQATAGRAVEGGLANARPGDILAFNSPVDHVGIYIGDGKMIEAPRTGLNVRVAEVTETPTAIRRILPDAPVAAARTAGAGAVSGVGGSGPVSGVPFAELFNRAGATHGVSPELLAEVARAESAFDPRAVSHAGAQGLMQLMPATARGLGVGDSFDPAQAVDGAARLLRDLHQQFGRTDLALAAYNAGPGAVLRYDGIPPYAETRAYVQKIMTSLGAS